MCNILDYFNTSSSHYITTILKTLEDYSIRMAVKVNWHYLPIDEDIFELGLNYKQTLDLDINLIPRKDNCTPPARQTTKKG